MWCKKCAPIVYGYNHGFVFMANQLCYITNADWLNKPSLFQQWTPPLCVWINTKDQLGENCVCPTTWKEMDCAVPASSPHHVLHNQIVLILSSSCQHADTSSSPRPWFFFFLMEAYLPQHWLLYLFLHFHL